MASRALSFNGCPYSVHYSSRRSHPWAIDHNTPADKEERDVGERPWRDTRTSTKQVRSHALPGWFGLRWLWPRTRGNMDASLDATLRLARRDAILESLCRWRPLKGLKRSKTEVGVDKWPVIDDRCAVSLHLPCYMSIIDIGSLSPEHERWMNGFRIALIRRAERCDNHPPVLERLAGRLELQASIHEAQVEPNTTFQGSLRSTISQLQYASFEICSCQY